MAVPTAYKDSAANSKTTGTTLASTTSASYALGDYLVVGFAMDPASGAVSFTKTGGTGAVGAFTTVLDVANGSGTSGVRTVVAYAKVTTAGTLAVTVTHPSAAARCVETFGVGGADGATPTIGSASSITSTEPLITPTVSGVDALAFSFCGWETASGTVGNDVTFGWTATGLAETTTAGTSGGGSSSNITSNAAAWTHTAIPATAVSVAAGSTTTLTHAVVSVLFQAPVVVTATTYNPVVVSQAVARASVW